MLWYAKIANNLSLLEFGYRKSLAHLISEVSLEEK